MKAVLTLLSMAFLLISRSQRTFKVEINVKAVLTSLNMHGFPANISGTFQATLHSTAGSFV